MTDFSFFKGKRVLVTGSTGFKGSWLCQWLVDLGAEVSGFALPPKDDAPLFDQLKLADRSQQIFGDIRDPDVVQATLDQSNPEIIIHLAAQALVRLSYDMPVETFATNVMGGVHLMEAARRCDMLKSLVFITSDKCYKNKEWPWGYRENDELGGPDPYSASKAAAELIFQSYYASYFKDRKTLGLATTRAGNVIGGGDFSKDRIIPDCIRAFKNADPVVLRYPDSTRPWQHVLEPLSGYLTLAAAIYGGAGERGGAWNFGPDAENVRSVHELAVKASEVWGSGEVVIDPAPGQLHEARLLMLNSDKAKSDLGWRPRWSFVEAVTQTVGWYRRVEDGEDPIEVTREQIADFSQVPG